MLRAAGAELIGAPAIELAHPDDDGTVDRALGAIAQYAWGVPTSTNGTDAMLGWSRRAAGSVQPRDTRVGESGPSSSPTHAYRANKSGKTGVVKHLPAGAGCLRIALVAPAGGLLDTFWARS